MSIYPWSTPLSTSGFIFFQAIANEITLEPVQTKKLVLESVLHQGLSKLACQVFKLDANSTDYPIILAIWVTAHHVAKAAAEHVFPTHPVPHVLDGYAGSLADQQAVFAHATRRFAILINRDGMPRECHKLNWNKILLTSFVAGIAPWFLKECYHEMASQYQA